MHWALAVAAMRPVINSAIEKVFILRSFDLHRENIQELTMYLGRAAGYSRQEVMMIRLC